MKGKVWSEHGTTWLHLGSIRANGSAGQRSICYHRIATWFDCCLLAVVCCHLATENVMKFLSLAFCYTATRGGVCCASHHNLLFFTRYLSITYFLKKMSSGNRELWCTGSPKQIISPSTNLNYLSYLTPIQHLQQQNSGIVYWKESHIIIPFTANNKLDLHFSSNILYTCHMQLHKYIQIHKSHHRRKEYEAQKKSTTIL